MCLKYPFLLLLFSEGINYEIHSEGCGDPGIKTGHCGISTIKVNGKDYSKKGRGINFVALDGKTGKDFSCKKKIL